MPEPFYSSIIEIEDAHPQLGALRYTIATTLPQGVPTDKINRIVIRALRLGHNLAIELTGGDT